ncbi:hypothetical protein D9M68_802180 [compost metagenome]
MEIAAQRLARVIGQAVAAHGLARFGPADLQLVARSGFAAEMRIERDDAVDLGAGQVQGLGDGLHRRGRDTAQFVLDRVQHGKQGAWLVFQPGKDAGGGRDGRGGGRLGRVQGHLAAAGAAAGRQIGCCLALLHVGLLLLLCWTGCCAGFICFKKHINSLGPVLFLYFIQVIARLQ